VIKLLLNPSYRVGRSEAAAILVSELDYLELPLHYLALLQQLQMPTDIDDIDANEQASLMHLGKLKLIVNANLRGIASDVASYWLARKLSLKHVDAQLNLGIQFIGTHAEKYRQVFTARYPECRVGEDDAALLVCVTSDLLDENNPDYAGRPQLMIKVGGVKQSIGPLLSPMFGLTDLRKLIRRPFDADLSISVPAGLQDAADGILLNELYHLRIEAGMHPAINHVIEWNLARMKRRLWKVRF